MPQLWGKMRQYRYPQAYRIIGVGSLSEVRDDMLREILHGSGTAQNGGREFEGLSIKGICEVCTNLWRLDLKLHDPETGEIPENMRLPGRHLQSIWDGLRSDGYEVHDHTGERMPEKGISGLKEISFERKEGLNHPVVLETIKPTITFNKKVIQMGEVIVGLPEQDVEEGPNQS